MDEVLSFLDIHSSRGDREINLDLFNDAKDSNLVYMVVTSLGTLYTINQRQVMLKRSNQEKQPNRLVLNPSLHIHRCLLENVPIVQLILLNDAVIRPRYCHRAIFEGNTSSAVKCSSMFMFGTVKLIIGSLEDEIAADSSNRVYTPKSVLLVNKEKLILTSTTFEVRIGSKEHRVYATRQQLLDNVRFMSSSRTLEQFMETVVCEEELND